MLSVNLGLRKMQAINMLETFCFSSVVKKFLKSLLYRKIKRFIIISFALSLLSGFQVFFAKYRGAEINYIRLIAREASIRLIKYRETGVYIFGILHRSY